MLVSLYVNNSIDVSGPLMMDSVLSEQTDIVVSHQQHNELNNLYFDVLHAHYPLIHNSPFFKARIRDFCAGITMTTRRTAATTTTSSM